MASVVRRSSPERAGDLAGDAVDPAPATDQPTEEESRPAAEPPRRGPVSRLPTPLRVPLQVLGRTLAKAWNDRILGLSAEAAFWQILSVPPLLIGLLGSLGYLSSWIGTAPVAQIEAELLSASTEALTPRVVAELVEPTLNDILGSGRLEVVSLGFVISLWAGSSATATFLNTVVIAYDQRDVRGPIRTRLMALWLFVIGLVLAVLTLPLLVLGRGTLVQLMPADWQDTATLLVNAVYWPLVVIALVLGLTSFYHVILPRRLPWTRHLLGGCFAVAFFMGAAVLLRSYVADILTVALPYGALAAPIAALLFCFLLGMSLLLGAELNATIEAWWPAPRPRHDQRRQRRRAAKIELEAQKLGLR
ncbi:MULTISPECIES: YihY/virulence factor BrkB family protein [unclassified Modestobacter]|uniref:YihY/virulence factor BrkB family protein n=1 Tax=unclassified Modestobacter TaxID=2643866 RepID=UPI0022AADBF7|nr:MULTISPECIES: YihY/virulence factor BrkB family protein [unclassified Modestobacter]MCZ2827206.1 YihY/virulence factor BrkB family protein [Modestobacter sp. VKM Ac-2981]MCZ2854886.1 YihY/virulence factor BrkB family protein [Modestobacter sp. VKM Ac-2982]